MIIACKCRCVYVLELRDSKDYIPSLSKKLPHALSEDKTSNKRQFIMCSTGH